MEPISLISIARDVKKISDFVYGPSLKEAISEVAGDIHLDAARFALDNVGTVNNKRDRICSVVTHLEAAHVSYVKSILSILRVEPGKKGTYLTDIRVMSRQMFNTHSINKIFHKDCLVCCLMSLCYVCLGESEMALKCADLPDAFAGVLPSGDDIDDKVIDTVIYAALLSNPFNIIHMFSNEKLCDKKFMNEFKLSLENGLRS